MAHAHVLVGAGPSAALPSIHRIRPSDLKDALSKGVDDFSAMPSHAIFLCIIYPLIGLVLAQLTMGFSFLHLLYPATAGFALVGPFAAIGLYELSRRREAGLPMGSEHAFDILHSPAIGAITALGLLLTAIFLIWMAVAHAIYVANFGYAPPASVSQFVRDVFETRAGWHLLILGNGIGLLFAVLVLTISVVSFPLLLDRDVGAAVALLTSVRAVIANPITMSLWGLIVAVLLVLGSLPLFLGLTVVLPVLGHSTWHLYRKVVEPVPGPRPDYHPRPKGRRYAADFPAVLFPWAREDQP
jgi:uncharacterized membrane protein